jgi:prepilin-type N-terminal cleavage/methylation domain-containing protein
MKTFRHKNPAFTLIELVLVIVVLGILAAVAIPRFDRDVSQEAGDNILSAIRYTQHLALMDYKHAFDEPDWQQKFWRIVFGTCTGTDKYYMIGADDSTDSSTNAYFAQSEAAIDAITGKPIFWTNGTDCSSGGDGSVSEDIFISKKYGITAVTSSGGCNGSTYIAFDHLGRPHHGINFSQSAVPNYRGYMKTMCTFTFTMSDASTFIIDILPETGYASIRGQEGS